MYGNERWLEDSSANGYVEEMGELRPVHGAPKYIVGKLGLQDSQEQKYAHATWRLGSLGIWRLLNECGARVTASHGRKVRRDPAPHHEEARRRPTCRRALELCRDPSGTVGPERGGPKLASEAPRAPEDGPKSRHELPRSRPQAD